MCVILYKPAGVQMPNESVLYQCYRINRDGMGFCTPTMVYHTLSYLDLIRALEIVPVDEPCVIHFRWATHGSVKVSNCHPFVAGDVKFAHNGVLPIKSVDDKTDSEIAFNKYIYPAICKYGFESPKADKVINEVAGSSRFAIMKGDEVELVGRWYMKKGVYFSNLNWTFSR